MCGRFALATTPFDLAALFGSQDIPNFAANYNIAPTNDILMVATGKGDTRRIMKVRWGLVPQWADVGGKPLFNARGETINQKPSFREAYQKRRCIVPANGFYEWQKTDNARTPYYVYRRDETPFAFAGIWDMKKNPNGEILLSASIITTAASGKFANIHQRFPVPLEKENWDEWLNRQADYQDLLKLLKPPKDDLIAFDKVSEQVNKISNNYKELTDKIT